MHRKQDYPLRWPKAIVLVSILLGATPAFAAAPNDAKAQALGNTAINEHYLAMNLELAEAQLQAAIKLCQGNKCSPSVHARLRRDLAMVYLAGKKEALAKQQLKQAVTLDPGLRLDPDLTTDELRKAFVEVGGVDGPAPAPAAEPQQEAPLEADADTEGQDDEQDEGVPSGLHWVSGALQFDTLLHKQTSEACSSGETYFCYTASGARYGYRGEAPLRIDYGDQVSGGIALATIRVLAGYDYHWFPAMTIGARVGFAFRGGPSDDIADSQSFLPLHLELRAQRLIGEHPFSMRKFTPYLGVQGGVAQVDSKKPIDVYTVGDTPVHYELEGYRKTGKGFVGLSAGSFYRMDAKWAPFAELVFMQMLPVSAQVFALRLGAAYAL